MQYNPFTAIDERLSRIENFLSNISDKKSESAQERSNKLLTRFETAKRLHISLVTLNDMTQKGKIKARRVGRRVLYLEADVEAVLIPIQVKPSFNSKN